MFFQRDILYKENKLKSFISFFICFSFIFDSGGGLKFRSCSILLCAILVAKNFFVNKTKINNSTILVYVLCVFLISVSTILSVLQNVQLSTAVTYSMSLLMFLPFYLLAKEHYLSIDGYCNAVLVFSVIIIILFFGCLFSFAPVLQMYNYIKANSSGMFGVKHFEDSLTVLPNVYFQGTLAIVPAAVFLAYKRKYISFSLSILALFLAPSRFGVLICLFFLCLINARKIYRVVLFFLVISIAIYISKIDIPMLGTFKYIFQGNYVGNTIRYGHLRGIVEVLSDNPLYFFFGQGPGSKFYSYGFNNYTETCEISHFDMLRRFGVINFVVINCCFFYELFRLYKKRSKNTMGAALSLLAHYCVAISNPVLLSLPAMIFYSCSVSDLSESLYPNRGE